MSPAEEGRFIVDYLERALEQEDAAEEETLDWTAGSGMVRRIQRRDRTLQDELPEERCGSWRESGAANEAAHKEERVSSEVDGYGPNGAPGQALEPAEEPFEDAVPAAERLEWALHEGRLRSGTAENSGDRRASGTAGAGDADNGGTLVVGKSAAVYGRAAAAGGKSAAVYGVTDRAAEAADVSGGGYGGRAAGMADALQVSGPGAGALYAGLLRNRTAAGYVRRETVAVTVPETPEQTSGGMQAGVQELDRQFQRDARRYDGGFALF